MAVTFCSFAAAASAWAPDAVKTGPLPVGTETWYAARTSESSAERATTRNLSMRANGKAFLPIWLGKEKDEASFISLIFQRRRSGRHPGPTYEIHQTGIWKRASIAPLLPDRQPPRRDWEPVALSS